VLVKIGNKIYDSTKEPILLVFGAQDKININNMPIEYMKYCSYPDSANIEDIKKFMNLEGREDE
jgi:hypothetical protein